MEEHIHLDIGGMSCIHCQTKIEDALNATKGVIKASVSYKKASADIEYDASFIPLHGTYALGVASASVF